MQTESAIDGIVYRITKEVDPLAVAALYEEVGWLPDDRDVSFIGPMLEASFAVVVAFDRERPIGLFRALSDGVSDAYLLDLCVRREYRRRGIGRRLIELLTAELARRGIPDLWVIGVPGTESLYRRCGARILQKYTAYKMATSPERQ